MQQSGKVWVNRAVKAIAVGLAIALAAAATFVMLGPQFGFRYAVISSGSMSPTYPVGSIAVMRDVDPADVKVGDVISWAVPGERDSMISHRVVEVVTRESGLAFRTQGDANEEPDPTLVEAASVRGRILFGVPEAGKIAPVLQERGLFLGIVVLCGALLIAMELEKIYRELRPKATPELAVAAPAPLDAMDEVRLALRWVFGPDSRSDTPPPELLRRRQHNNSQGTKS